MGHDAATHSDSSPNYSNDRKVIHWVRHAEGVHNVESRKNHDALMSPALLDAQLSQLGWQQVSDLREHVQSSGILKRIDLVIVSPLLRTMQTAVGVFGGENSNELQGPVLMVAGVGGSDCPAVSSVDCPPFLAVELCRERLGVHPCDKRRSVKEYKPLFPGIDFSQIDSDEDVLWTPDHRESPEEIAARAVKFMNWLRMRPEKEIAIVTHSVFLKHTLNIFGEECPADLSNFLNNCELRSMVLVDRSSELKSSEQPSGADHEVEETPATQQSDSLKLISLGNVPN